MWKVELLKLIDESFSISDLALKIFGYANGRAINETKFELKKNGIDISIFDGRNMQIKNERIIKICPVCNEEFKTIKNKKEKTVCSISCANSYFKHGVNNPDFDKSKSELMYEKISYSLRKRNPNGRKKHKKICLTCKLEFETIKNKQKYCSSKCSHNSDIIKKDLSKKAKERYEEGKLKGWQTRNIESYPEKFFKKVLKNNNIKFEFNKSIKKRDLGIDCDANYFLDFYIFGTNIDLEIDGKQHKYVGRESSDGLRDESLIKNGYDVYRIGWRSINTKNGKEYIKKEIEKFLTYYKNKIDSIR